MRFTRRLLLAAACLWALTAPGAWANHEPLNDVSNCADFTFQEDAQQVYDATLILDDPNHLDEDGDRIACESLPRRGPGGGVTQTTVGTTQTTVGTTQTTVGTTATTVRGTATTAAARRALVRTGSEDGPWMAIAALLIATGGAFVAIGRGRRSVT
jgi:hypothetical protein